MLDDYIFGKQTLKQLSIKVGHSYKLVRRKLDETVPVKQELIPQKVVVIPDTTFFGRTYGICVFRSPHLKRNIWCIEVDKEIMATYY